MLASGSGQRKRLHIIPRFGLQPAVSAGGDNDVLLAVFPYKVMGVAWPQAGVHGSVRRGGGIGGAQVVVGGGA